jgi:hypothetical protein
MRGVVYLLNALLLASTLVAQTPAPAANLNAKFLPALLNSGANNVSSIVYVGKGMVALPRPTGELAAGAATKFVAAIGYGLMSTRVEIERPGNPKHVVQFMANDTAWDVVDDKKPTLNSTAVALRQALLYMTPHGAVKAAFDPQSKRTLAEETVEGKVVTTFTFIGGRSKFKGYLDEKGMVTKVQTLPGDPVFGDVVVEFMFTGYKDVDTASPANVPKGSMKEAYNDIMAPSHIVEKINGNTVLDIGMTEVRPNAAPYVEVPEPIERALAGVKR